MGMSLVLQVFSHEPRDQTNQNSDLNVLDKKSKKSLKPRAKSLWCCIQFTLYRIFKSANGLLVSTDRQPDRCFISKRIYININWRYIPMPRESNKGKDEQRSQRLNMLSYNIIKYIRSFIKICTAPSELLGQVPGTLMKMFWCSFLFSLHVIN